MRMSALRWICVGILGLVGGVVVKAAGYADPPAPTSWVGRTQKELIQTLGDPESVRVRPDGTVLLEYLIKRDGVPCRVVYLVLPDGRIAAEKSECT